MAQANPFDQFDGQVQPVPMRQLQPIIGANPITPAQQATIEEKTFRTMTPQEMAAQGLPAGGVYQINGLGEIKEVRAAPSAEQEQKAQVQQGRIKKLETLLSQLDKAEQLYREGIKGGLPNPISGRVLPFSEANSAFGAASASAAQQAFSAFRVPGEGPQSDADLKLFVEANRPLPTDTEAAIEEKFRAVRERALGEIEALGGTVPASTAPAAQTPETEVSGTGAFLSEEDKALQARITAAYNRGAPIEELQAIAQEYGRTFPVATQEELDAGRAQGRGVTVSPTGQRTAAGELLGAAAESPVGAYFVGAANALTSGGMDELAPILGLDADTVQAAKEMLRERYPVSSFAGEVSGSALQLGAGGAALRGAGVGARGLAGAEIAQGALYGAGESNDNRLGGALIGAGGAVVGQQVGRAITSRLATPEAQQVVNRIAEETGAPPEAVQQVVAEAVQGARPRVERDASQIIASGAAENVPVMTSDVRRPRTWFGNWLQGTGEKLPVVGTGGVRAAQQESRVAMIERLADEYAATPATIDDVTADFMSTRGKEIGKYTEQKREVFSQIAGAPPPVPMASLDALDMAIGRFGQQETYAPLVARIQGWRNDLANARGIQDIEDLRKAIGDTFNDESMKSASTALRGIVNGPEGLYAAIKKDMAGYIRDNAGEQGLAKWSAANAKLADFAEDLGKNTLDRVLKRGEATPEEASSLLFSKRPSDVKALFKNLSPDGQKRARALVVQKLVDDAGGLAELSTAKFRSAMQRSADTFGVIFPKEEADRLTGMLRLLQATRRAEQASVTTPTGQSTLPLLGAGGVGFLAGDWFGAAGAGAVTAAAFKAYESKAMRNLLVSLSKSKPGSKGESNLLATIGKVAARAAPVAATTQTRPEAQQTSTIEVR